MNFITAIRTAAACFVACTASTVAAQNWQEDDPNVAVEVVDVRTLSLIPGGTPATGLSMPSPDHPALGNSDASPSGAHIQLTDIPFSVNADTRAGDASLWDRIRSRFVLDELPSPLVKEWENWYASRPEYMSRMIARGGRYLFHVVEELEKRGMPGEIALLPMIESAYNPSAYSSAQASGIWQFIPSTGKIYGLKQNWWQDERRDVLAATRAALDYLEKLYEMFGSWELALAAYNWGEGAVTRAIQRNEALGQRTDYLNLEMPAETRNYVPKLLAVKNLIAHPEDFGLTLADIPNRPYFAVITTERSIDVKLAAQFAGLSLEEFRALNPSHNRPVIRGESSQPILLPTDRVERFQANFEAHGAPLVTWQSYTIAKSDSLAKVAARFGISAEQLQSVNSLSGRMRNLAGLTILVPGTANKGNPDIAAAGFVIPPPPEVTAPSSVKYVVKHGDSLAAIAKRFGVSVAQLSSRNGIRNGRILAGQSLDIEATQSAVPARAHVQVQATVRTPTSIKVAAKAPTLKSAANKKIVRSTSKKAQSTRVEVAYAPRTN